MYGRRSDELWTGALVDGQTGGLFSLSQRVIIDWLTDTHTQIYSRVNQTVLVGRYTQWLLMTGKRLGGARAGHSGEPGCCGDRHLGA